MKREICSNCGASLDVSKTTSGVCTCEFCRTKYHIDEYGMVEEYRVKLKIFGKTMWFYLESMRAESAPVETYRDINGNMRTYIPDNYMPNFELTMRSYKVED